MLTKRLLCIRAIRNSLLSVAKSHQYTYLIALMDRYREDITRSTAAYHVPGSTICSSMNTLSGNTAATGITNCGSLNKEWSPGAHTLNARSLLGRTLWGRVRRYLLVALGRYVIGVCSEASKPSGRLSPSLSVPVLSLSFCLQLGDKI